jgi:hypothetical protein
MTVLRRVSERRNALVHPKTREWKLGTTFPFPEKATLDQADESVAEMKQFFERRNGRFRLPAAQ